MFSPKTAPAVVPSISLPSFPSRLVHRFLIFSSFIVILHFLRLHKSFGGWHPETTQYKTYSACDALRPSDLNDTLVIMKTGANEAPDKLPVHFDTTLRCVPHYVVYSDLNETVEGHQVYDALDEVNPEIKTTHPDFRYYQALQAEGRAAFTNDQLMEWATAGNTGLGRNTPGWKLDKWKFLPIADKAYRQKPDAKWFVFLEADTYIIWRNMVAWLAQFDASKPYYLGMQMQVAGQVFGYGGAGFVLSNSALKRLVEYHNENLEYWDWLTGKHWAGDCVLGQALKKAGIELTFSWPNLASENPVDMNFNATFGGKGEFWCHYATTYHHLTPQEIVEFSEFERDWNQVIEHLLPTSPSFLSYPFTHVYMGRLKTESHGTDRDHVEIWHAPA